MFLFYFRSIIFKIYLKVVHSIHFVNIILDNLIHLIIKINVNI